MQVAAEREPKPEPEPGHRAAPQRTVPWRPPWPLPIGAAGGWPAQLFWKTSSSRQSSWAGAHCSLCSSQRAFIPTCVRSQVRWVPWAGVGSLSPVLWERVDCGEDLTSNALSLHRVSRVAKGTCDPQAGMLGPLHYHCSRFIDEETDSQGQTSALRKLGTVIDPELPHPAVLCPQAATCWPLVLAMPECPLACSKQVVPWL